MAGRLSALLGVSKQRVNTKSSQHSKDDKQNKRPGVQPLSRPHKRVRRKPRKDEDESEDAEEHQQLDPVSGGAYNKLVDLFATRSTGAAAQALKQRRQEAEGDSEGESDEDDADEDDDDANGFGSDELESDLRSDEDEDLSEDPNADPAAADANGAPAADAAAADSDREEADHDVETSEEEDAAAAAAAAEGGAAAAAAAEDHWSRHFQCKLTDEQIALLQSGGGSWQEAEETAAAYGRSSSSSSSSSSGLWNGGRWQVSGCSGLPPAPAQLQEYGVKERLQAKWKQAQQQQQQQQQEEQQGDFSSAQQQQLFSLFNSYRDVFLAERPYATDAAAAADAAADAYLLHVINHVFKAADNIKRNNAELRAKAAAAGAAAGGRRRRGGAAGAAAADAEPVSANVDISEVPRDQGFTRPKVLILLPMRGTAYRVVTRLVELALGGDKSAAVHNRERFEEQFTEDDDEAELPERQRRARAAKPAEHKATFAGNTDDHFRLGIRLTRGSVKLFADLYQSDVIVASPIALATKLAEDKKKGEGEGDFLSSVEVLVIDRADVLLMQNWAHVVTVLEHTNRMPKQQHGTDIMRIREWFLSGAGGCYRQTILLSSFANADMNAAVQRFCRSHAGRLRLKPHHAGVLSTVVPQVRQLFERHAPASPADCSSARLEFFKTQLWPRIKEGSPRGLLLFVPHYFDYVRLRNFLAAEDHEFAELCEYTPQSQVARGRSLFARGEIRLMVLTERAHFYNRYKIRGIQEVLFYSLPEHGQYYCELVNLLEGGPAGGQHGTVTAMYSRFEALQLERVVGSSRARKMLKGGSSTYMFC